MLSVGSLCVGSKTKFALVVSGREDRQSDHKCVVHALIAEDEMHTRR